MKPVCPSWKSTPAKLGPEIKHLNIFLRFCALRCPDWKPPKPDIHEQSVKVFCCAEELPVWFVFLLQVNFVLFISIIRILVQKLRCTDVGGNEQSQYRLGHDRLHLGPLVVSPDDGYVFVSQALGQVHPPADPSVWGKLRGVCLPDGAGRQKHEPNQDLLWARPRVLPGTTGRVSHGACSWQSLKHTWCQIKERKTHKEEVWGGVGWILMVPSPNLSSWLV